MRVLVFRHSPEEDTGHVRPVLEERGIGVECADLFRDGATAPDVTCADGLIFLGGPMSANDDLPWLKQEIRVIAEAVGRSQPVLGVCLGAQLMARALGSRVYRNPVKEIGWYPVRLTPAAADDKLFSGLPDPLTVFHWHGDTFDLPPGAVRLAESETCRNQAFRLGRSAYGLQFHPEVTPATIAEWNRQDACGEVRETASAPDPFAYVADQASLARHLFGRWARSL